ncbi:MAG TPA: ACP S-malonyltransferase [Gemmatimonadaceae bacterium]|nr:ACP S-malonyltransferase [Gemmatimonadaceae bacterium]HUK21770.1 ACP S-malonyltransferase [Gemmatimonadales bacterium]
MVASPPTPTVWLCPGQGAQKVGMARDLAERFPESRAALDAIDDALGFKLSRLMFDGPEDELTATKNAQPAILAHSAAVHAALGAAGATPVAAAGHSLGEYSAYVTSGALTAPQAASVVRRRGELMHEAGTERPGAMAAVLGLAASDVEAACQEVSGSTGVAVAANLNAPDQTVISGDPETVDKAAAACRARGAKRVVPLKVSGAFHSPLMAPAANRLRVILDRAPFRDPRFPVLANATGEAVTTAARARRLLTDQVTAPVRWIDCVEHAARIGGEDTRFVEIGPGSVLTGLLKRILPGASGIALGTADEVTKFLEA